MKRRSLLASGVAALGSLAGCLGGGTGGATTAPATGTTTRLTTTAEGTPQEIGSGDATTAADDGLGSPREVTANPGDPTPTDGFAPPPDDPPAEREVDTSSFQRISVDGELVALAPIDVAHYWWARGEARFADARGLTQYDGAHVLGAVASPVQSPIDDTYVGDWATDERIVCYCGCPHHLSSIRAATLQAAGYESVYVIDEGFFEWVDRSYPVVGEAVGERRRFRIRGRTRPRYAGEMVWARHVGSDRVEAAPVQSDGSYELDVRFAGVGPDATVRVEAPDYTVTGTLGDLSAEVVTARMAD